jgi:hypothetical protein
MTGNDDFLPTLDRESVGLRHAPAPRGRGGPPE